MSLEKVLQVNVGTGETEELEVEMTLPNPRISEIQFRMKEIQGELASTDYKTNKYIEGDLPEEEWVLHTANRKALRGEYNSIEAELNTYV